MSHCAPCHLPGIDSSIDPRLAEDLDAVKCEICGTDEQEGKLLLCDICSLGYHTFCLTPPLSAVPDDTWLCPVCLEQGFTSAEAEARELQRQELEERESAPVLFPDAAMKKRDQAAAAKHGRLVKKAFKDSVTGQTRDFWGRIQFLGPLNRPNYYHIIYEDSDSEIMGNRQLNKIIQPVETQLPAGDQHPHAT